MNNIVFNNKEYPFRFGYSANKLFGKLTGKSLEDLDKDQSLIEDVIYAGLKSTAEKEGVEFDLSKEDIEDVMEENFFKLKNLFQESLNDLINFKPPKGTHPLKIKYKNRNYPVSFKYKADKYYTLDKGESLYTIVPKVFKREPGYEEEFELGLYYAMKTSYPKFKEDPDSFPLKLEDMEAILDSGAWALANFIFRLETSALVEQPEVTSEPSKKK